MWVIATETEVSKAKLGWRPQSLALVSSPKMPQLAWSLLPLCLLIPTLDFPPPFLYSLQGFSRRLRRSVCHRVAHAC